VAPGARPALTVAHRWVIGTLALVGVCVCAAVIRSAGWPGNVLVGGVLLVPLLLPLRGLLRGDRRTHAWATLCIAPYLVYGITESVANPAVRAAAAGILLASLAHFVSLVAYLRLSRRPSADQVGPTP
jgi:uncharacterized membrane protein